MISLASTSRALVAFVLISLAGADALASDQCTVVVADPVQADASKIRHEIATRTRCEVTDMDWLRERCSVGEGLECQDVLRSPGTLSRLANDHSVRLFVHFLNDGWDLHVRVVGPDGAELEKRRLDSASAVLTEQHMPLILAAVEEHLPPREAQAKPSVVATPGPVETPKAAEKRSGEAAPRARGSDSASSTVADAMVANPADDARKSRWLSVSGTFDFTQRLLVVSDLSQRSSNLRTPFSPGYRIRARAYPFPGSDSLGFEASFAHGFDQVSFVRPSGDVDAAVTRLGASAAFVYRTRNYDEYAFYGGTQTLLRAGLSWGQYSIDQQFNTPLDTNHAAVELGVTIIQSIYRDLLGFDWSLTAQPWVKDLSDNDLGAQDWGLGLSTHAAIGVQPFEGFVTKLGWGAGAVRTWYSGPAFNNFEDVNSIVFEHSPSVSLEYGW